MADDVLRVAALLKRRGQILLVRQCDRGVPRSDWVLPGDVAESAELLLETLQRAVRQTTGLEIVRIGDLIAVAQSLDVREYDGEDETANERRATTFVVSVAEWRGDLLQTDAENVAFEARFWSQTEAIEHLERQSIRALSEPIAAYLRGGEQERLWLYRPAADGTEQRQWPIRETSPEVTEQLRRARAIVALGCIVVLAILVIIVVIGLITLARPFA